MTWLQATPPGGCRCWAELSIRQALSGGARDVGSDDIDGVAAEAAAGPVTASWSADWLRGSFPHVTQRHPGVKRGGDEGCRSVCGVTSLPVPARRAVLRTIRPAPFRSSRRPSAARNTGSSVSSPMARSIARAVRGASGTVTALPPLRVMVKVRCPRSRPRCCPARSRYAGNKRAAWRSDPREEHSIPPNSACESSGATDLHDAHIVHSGADSYSRFRFRTSIR